MSGQLTFMGLPLEMRQCVFDFLDQKTAGVLTSVSPQCKIDILKHIIRREMRVFQEIIAPVLRQYGEEFVYKEVRIPRIGDHPAGKAQVSRLTKCITGTNVKAIDASVIALIYQIVNSRLALWCDVGHNLQAHFGRDKSPERRAATVVVFPPPEL